MVTESAETTNLALDGLLVLTTGRADVFLAVNE